MTDETRPEEGAPEKAPHIPVLLTEVLAALDPSRGGVYLDGTLGAGGYTRAILDAGADKVYALDLNADGRILWKYEPKQDPDVIPVMCCDTVNRGPAYANGMIILHQADTTVVALDAKTGAVKWSAVNGDPSKGETNTATVLPVKAGAR